MKPNYFITGTDTNIGKTIVSSILVSVLDGYYWKPIQSGIDHDIPDAEAVKALSSAADTRIIPSVYSLKAPLSPDQAAKLEGIDIQLDKINLPSKNIQMIIEGAGGVCVPINENCLMLDLIKKCQCPVIIVARGTLGTINHTLLTIHILKSYGISIYGVVFSGDLVSENQHAIEQWGKVKTLFHLPTLTCVDNNSLSVWIEDNYAHLLSVLT